jgi:hypothetical protein
LIDIKTGQPVPADAIQTAAYVLCLAPGYYRRYGIYLQANGDYRPREHKDYNDTGVFLAALAVAQWKRNKE